MKDHVVLLRFTRENGAGSEGWKTIEHAETADLAREQALYKAGLLNAPGGTWTAEAGDQ